MLLCSSLKYSVHWQKSTTHQRTARTAHQISQNKSVKIRQQEHKQPAATNTSGSIWLRDDNKAHSSRTTAADCTWASGRVLQGIQLHLLGPKLALAHAHLETNRRERQGRGGLGVHKPAWGGSWRPRGQHTRSCAQACCSQHCTRGCSNCLLV
jgi:hypothetical protein